MTGYLSTEATIGNTGGTYNRTTEAIAFTLSSATYTGVNFGQVPANQFMTDGQKSALPGTTIYYTHQFTPVSGGQVTFTSSASSPAGINWTQVLCQDTSSSGKIASSDPIITGPINVVAGQEICLLLKQFVPANAAHRRHQQDHCDCRLYLHQRQPSHVLHLDAHRFNHGGQSDDCGAGTL
jgi:hypothetical protein